MVCMYFTCPYSSDSSFIASLMAIVDAYEANLIIIELI